MSNLYSANKWIKTQLVFAVQMYFVPYTLFRIDLSTFCRAQVGTYIEMHVVQNIKSHDLRFWCVLPAYSSLYWKCRTNLMTGKLPESLKIIIIIKQQVTQQFMALFLAAG